MSSRLLTFQLADHVLAVDIESVREVLTSRPLLTVPMAPDAVAGVLIVRGGVIATVDLRACLDLPRATGAHTIDAIVLDAQGMTVAIAVDEIGDVVDVTRDLLRPPDTVSELARSLARGTYFVDDRTVLVLDPVQIVVTALTSTKELVR